MREFRVKDEAFSSFSVNGSVITAQFLPHVINGQVDKIVFTNVTSPGSIWVCESGTNVEIYRKNDVASGASFEVYPKIFNVMTNGVSGSPYIATNVVTNNVLYLAGSGFTSGAAKVFGPVIMYYR